ncbi:uncharacterized protein [Ptychodera flava]|uniref:uncharacterized protein n=1 Tax=Ptychodera flava TaxID=63121 RepID=UPI00396A8FB5
MLVSVLSKVCPSGSWTTFRRWLASMASQPIKLPCAGDLAIAFDNDQIVQKQYEVKAGGKPRVSILTSVCYVVFGLRGLQLQQDLAPSNWMQHSNALINKEIKEDLMKTLLAKERLRAAFAVVRKEMKKQTQIALEEVVRQQCNEESGVIVDDIDKRIEEMRHRKDVKICPACSTEMKKTARKCPNTQCGENFKDITEKLSGKQNLGTMLIRPTREDHGKMKSFVVMVSETGAEADVTERANETGGIYSHLQSGHIEGPVKVSCAEPIFVNPNSQKTVRQVLKTIGEAGNIAHDSTDPNFTERRKWMKVTMDGLPYMIARSIITDTYHCVLCSETLDSEKEYEPGGGSPRVGSI